MTTFWVGAILLAATDAMVLAGAAYNRSGEPEAVLTLSERELSVAGGQFESEGSGISLQMQWRLPRPSRGKQGPVVDHGFAGIGGEAAWLDKAKLVELGFDVSRPNDTPEGQRYYDKQLPKDVFLVLEFNGPAHAGAIRAAEERLQEARARASENPKIKTFSGGVELAAKALADEQSLNSRLFVVDTGRDSSALRAKYPDRKQYAIVAGRIRMASNRFLGSRPFGYISDLDMGKVNVPVSYAKVFESVPRQRSLRRTEAGPRFEATIAFGKRLEPWLQSAH
jgi:hypothetical protein